VGIRSGSSFCCRRPALLSAPHQNPAIPWSLLPNRSPAAALTPTTVLGQPIAVGITSWLLVCWFVWLPGSNATAAMMMTRSAEDRAAGKFSAAAVAAARAEKQRAVSPHKVGPGSVMGLGVPDPKPQQQYNQGGSGSGSGQQAGAAAGASSKPAPKLEVPRIYTTLSRKEKEDDFMAMKGTKLPQRPKRRPKNVEKTINVRAFFPLFLH